MKSLSRCIAIISLVVISSIGCNPKDKSESQKPPEVVASIAKEKTDENPTQKPAEVIASVDKEKTDDKSSPEYVLKQDQVQSSDVEKVRKISVSGEIESFFNTSIFIGVIFLLIATNILTLLITKGILKWRKVVNGGMSAVVPSELLRDFGHIKTEQAKQGNVTNENIKRIAEYLGSSAEESITILKQELELKETELARLRDFHKFLRKREALIKKVIRLHSLLTRMGNHVASGEINNSSAIDFISEELADIFVDFGIHVISPNLEQKASDFTSETLSIAGFISTNNQKAHLTINKLNDVGYSYTPLIGNAKVLRPAVVILNKFEG